MSRRINDLAPHLRSKAEALIAAADAAGIPIRITHTLRTWDEQAHLFAKGRKLPGSVVTNAPPGFSPHNFGWAFDVRFLGKTIEEMYPSAEVKDDAGKNVINPVWLKIGEMGEALGLKWGGRWQSFLDVPHFELIPRGMTLALARRQHEAGLAENVA